MARMTTTQVIYRRAVTFGRMVTFRRQKITFFYILALCGFAVWVGTQDLAAQRPLKNATGPSANVYPLHEGYVDAHGVMIYYAELGWRGKPLMIVHGGPGASHDYFLPYLLPLARHHRLIFIDERGSGRSQKLEDRRATASKTWWRMWKMCAWLWD